MKNHLGLVVLFCVGLAPISECRAEDDKASAENANAIRMETDQPNYLGYTASNSGPNYYDFFVSLKAQISVAKFTGEPENLNSDHMLYFGFNFHAGFYLGSVDSSPVIGKRFNPYLRYVWFNIPFVMKTRHDQNVEYVDVELGHLSNGQIVDSLDKYNHQLALANQDATFANNYISRSWEYLELRKHGFHAYTVTATTGNDNSDTGIAYDIALRKYMTLFSDTQERQWDFEPQRNNKATDIQQVSGLRLGLRIDTPEWYYVKNPTVMWESGFPLGKYTSQRLSVDIWPRYLSGYGTTVIAWVRTGYNESLATYFQSSRSFGIAFTFETHNSKEISHY